MKLVSSNLSIRAKSYGRSTSAYQKLIFGSTSNDHNSSYTMIWDSQDPNPLIRDLAVRTMGCIRADKIIEYLCDPLQRCLKDDDPYVRKTVAICVAKLYDINVELVEDKGFLNALNDLISDNNPMVATNVVADLAEIQESSSRPIFEITSHTLSKFLTALNKCTEWGQVFILDSLSKYKVDDAR
ncbi:hypothetical protein T459_16458 [Capsicum annuum]|uniref:Condensin complex subunit 1 C-terminal domain-containing protein n=1 Tax=Capsicum annuum TaxID=4072 RepID=A0A2G2Z8S7_CAPAN|nr:hypothetical protein FXO37_04725 [Capsicum annuum]PHT78406.1 hypothetical protein T459_16458 [Capsicum annuum]